MHVHDDLPLAREDHHGHRPAKMVLSLSRAMSVVAKGLGGRSHFRRGRYHSSAFPSLLCTFLANPNEFSDARLLSSNSAQPLQVATQSRRRQPALIDRHRRSNPLCTATARPATSERRTKVRRSSDAPTPLRTPARPAHDSRLTNDDSHLTPCPSTPTPPQNKAPNGAAQISAQCVSAGKTNTSNQTSRDITKSCG